MWKEEVKLAQALRFLNELVELDPEAVTALCENRVSCNEAVAQHESVQVSAQGDNHKEYSVGLLGVLNGMFGADNAGWGQIAAKFELVCSGCGTVALEDQPYEPGTPCPKCSGTYKGVVTGFDRLDPSKYK
jgi:hypothetical protein